VSNPDQLFVHVAPIKTVAEAGQKAKTAEAKQDAK